MMLHWDSCHPDYMQSTADADLPYERLWAAARDEPWRWRYVGEEVRQCQLGHVPIFTHVPAIGVVM